MVWGHPGRRPGCGSVELVGPVRVAVVPPPELAATIRRRRLALGLSQAQLGRLVGRSSSAVAGWEAGRASPGDDETMDALAEVLGLDDPAEEPAIDGSWAASETTPREPIGVVPASQSDMSTTDATAAVIDPAPQSTKPTAEALVSGRATPSNGRVAVPAAPSISTVVVAPNRRVAARVAKRAGGSATVGIVESVRTDVDPIYRSRAIVTAAVLVACFVVFGWAFTRAAGELGAILEVVFAPFR